MYTKTNEKYLEHFGTVLKLEVLEKISPCLYRCKVISDVDHFKLSTLYKNTRSYEPGEVISINKCWLDL